MITKILASPQKYIQGPGALNDLAKWAKAYGKNVYVILDDFVRSIAGKRIIEGGKKEGINIQLNKFNGESSDEEIAIHTEEAKKFKADVVVGVGGGKTLDTAKAVAYLIGNKPVIISPTLASTDAPTSALAIIYHPDGEFKKYMHLPFNPNIVLIDTEMVVKAPVRFLISGIGDALATFYEARVCVEANATNMAGGISTKGAFALATLCKDVLFKNAVQSIQDCKDNKITPAFEAVVEANTLLSGLGFESSGLAGAHAIHDGLTELHESHNFLHGEKVAFGVITEAMMNDNMEEFKDIVEFCLKVGLPVCLEDYGIIEDINNKAEKVALKTIDKDETIHSYPYEITKDMVKNAILKADKEAKKIKEGFK